MTYRLVSSMNRNAEAFRMLEQKLTGSEMFCIVTNVKKPQTFHLSLNIDDRFVHLWLPFSKSAVLNVPPRVAVIDL